MDNRVSLNRLRWDEMASLHKSTYFHNDRSANDASLMPFEITELGDLTGLRVCHLQCHIGGDSLSLARLGAEVVGVDFSAVALEIARGRAADAGLDERVTFVHASIDEVADLIPGEFDGVYTSWGVLCWLPRIDDWARTVSRLLRGGGWIYLAETHPYAASVRWQCPYGGATVVFSDGLGDYTDDNAKFESNDSWEWTHGVGEVVTALAQAGMRIEWLHEFPYAAWHLNDENVRRRPDGLYEDPESTVPLSFTLRATKPATGDPADRT